MITKNFANDDYIIRSLSRVDEGDYMLSLASDFNYIEFITNSKSGQFFFYSFDSKYMIKTISYAETKLLRKMLPQYTEHIAENPDSLLVRFYGLHRVKMSKLYGKEKMYFVIMGSVFNTDGDDNVKIHKCYDLKGSTIGRITKQEDINKGEIQKDLNIIESKEKLMLAEHREVFQEIIKKDVVLLQKLNIMDYSLLVGVHESQMAKEAQPAKSGKRRSSVQLASNIQLSARNHDSQRTHTCKFKSTKGGLHCSMPTTTNYHIYYFGIIDILQQYDTGKKVETFFKSKVLRQEKAGLSSVDAITYGNRFIKFITSLVFVSD